MKDYFNKYQLLNWGPNAYLSLTPLIEIIFYSIQIHSFPLCAQVHYPPYLFEAFLLEPVDDVRSAAKVGNGVVVISLTKKANKIWDHLVIPTRKTCPFIDCFFFFFLTIDSVAVEPKSSFL